MLNFIGKNQFMMLQSPKNLQIKTKQDFSIKYHFSNFIRPELDNTSLNIAVDHSYKPLNDDYILFIDHHIVEQNVVNKVTDDQFVIENSLKYCVSNANLMYNIYEDIIEVVKSLKFDSVNVFMHTDLDGIASGLIMRQILEDVKNNTMSKDKILLSMILGNYGDLFKEAKFGLVDLFPDPTEVVVFDKKLKIIVKQIGRFMKSVRPSLDSILKIDSIEKIDETKNKFLKNSIDIEDLNHIVQDLIFGGIENMTNVNTINVISYLNTLLSNKTFQFVNEEFQNVINNTVNEYISPKYPMIELTAIFKNDPTSTEYKILFIDSLFDCARSIVWKYRIGYGQLVRKSVILSKWSYNVTNYKKKDHHKLMSNIACFNKQLNKLTLDSKSTDSAFKIATTYSTPGGGHLGTSDSGGSIGSVIVPEKEFMDSIIIKEFF